MKVVSLPTTGCIAGKICIPEDLRPHACQFQVELAAFPEDLPITDQSNILPGEVQILIPICTMNQCSLVILDSGDSWPSPVIQHTTTVDENVTLVMDGPTSRQIFDLNVPMAASLIPLCPDNLVIGLAILSQIVLHHEIVEIGVYLLGRSINS